MFSFFAYTLKSCKYTDAYTKEGDEFPVGSPPSFR